MSPVSASDSEDYVDGVAPERTQRRPLINLTSPVEAAHIESGIDFEIEQLNDSFAPPLLEDDDEYNEDYMSVRSFIYPTS